jgi:hypothetical protein
MIKDTFNTIFSYSKKSIGFVLFVICSYAIYTKVLSNEHWFEYTQHLRNLLFDIQWDQWLILILLMGFNFIIESIKWQKVVKSSEPIRFMNAIKGVLVGQTFAFFTPNRIGEYAGRTLFLSAGNKLIGMTQLAWASYAQLLVTLFVGSFAFAIHVNDYNWIDAQWLYWIKMSSPGIGIVAIFIFFYKKEWSRKLKFLNIIQIETSVKVNLLILSFVRYLIFLMQYVWVAYMLKMNIEIIHLVLSIAILFLFLSILPTVSVTELVVRGQLLLMILAPIYHEKMNIISLSSIIWGVNFLIPSIIGAFLLLGYRLNR